MDYKSFIAKYYSDANEYTLSYIEFFLNQVKKMVIEAKRTMGENVTDKEIFTTLFEDANNIQTLSYSAKYKRGKKSDIGMTKLYILKPFLVNFVDWLNEQGFIENYEELNKFISTLTPENMLSEDNMSQTYFKSIEDVIKFIDYIGEQCFNSLARTKKNFDFYDSTDDLLFTKAIAILSWNGYTYEQMIQMKKEDVCIRGNTNYFINKPTRKNISFFEYRILKNFIQSDSHRGIPSGRLIKYNNNEMLLRPQKARLEMVPNAIVCHLARFNEYAAKVGSPLLLSQKSLARSGFYALLHENCKYNTDNITQNIMRMKNCDYSQAFKDRQYYEKWLKMFYSNEQ